MLINLKFKISTDTNGIMKIKNDSLLIYPNMELDIWKDPLADVTKDTLICALIKIEDGIYETNSFNADHLINDYTEEIMLDLSLIHI